MAKKEKIIIDYIKQKLRKNDIRNLFIVLKHQVHIISLSFQYDFVCNNSSTLSILSVMRAFEGRIATS